MFTWPGRTVCAETAAHQQIELDAASAARSVRLSCRVPSWSIASCPSELRRRPAARPRATIDTASERAGRPPRWPATPCGSTLRAAPPDDRHLDWLAAELCCGKAALQGQPRLVASDRQVPVDRVKRDVAALQVQRESLGRDRDLQRIVKAAQPTRRPRAKRRRAARRWRWRRPPGRPPAFVVAAQLDERHRASS